MLGQASSASGLCQKISTVPGIGPIVSTALIAAIGNGSQFKKARDLSAWLGLVPRQYSTGGKSSLGGISKRGNSYLRQMVIQGAKALKIHMKRDKSSLGEWVARLEVGHHHHGTYRPGQQDNANLLESADIRQGLPTVSQRKFSRLTDRTHTRFCEPKTDDRSVYPTTLQPG